MTLDELLADLPPLNELRGLWLILDEQLRNRLLEVQPKYQNQVVPVALLNGAFTLCADLLSEKDGIYARTFALLDQSVFPQIPVLPYDSIAHLFPSSDEP
jgi:hypothetical protein